MKLFTLLLFFSINLMVIAQPAISWGPEISVADGTMYGNIRPRISVSADGNPLVLFGKGTEGYLFVAKGNGSGFDTPISILPPNVQTYLSYWTGPDLASAGDTVIAVFKALPYETGKIYSVRSVDGGLTYSDTMRVDSHETGRAWMPAIDMDVNGNTILTYMAHEGSSTNPHFIYSKSIDAGLTFSPEIDIDGAVPGEACDCCPAEVVIKGDQEVVLYRNNDVNIRDIYGIYSSDGGLSFPTFANVDQMNWNINSCPSTGPDGVFVANGLVTTFASKGSGFNRCYVSNSSTSGGISFVENLMLTPPMNANGKQIYPRIANDDNTLVVVWAEAETSNNEIFCAISTDGTLTQLNDTKHQVNMISSGSQTNPDIVVNGNEVHLVYQDYNSGDVIYKKGTLSAVSLNELEKKSVLYPNPIFQDETIIIEGVENDLKLNNVKINNALGELIPFEGTIFANRLELKLDKKVGKGTYIIELSEKHTYTFVVQ
jgi:hypothetical protein